MKQADRPPVKVSFGEARGRAFGRYWLCKGTGTMTQSKFAIIESIEMSEAVIDIQTAREAATQRELMKQRLRLLPPPVSAELPTAAYVHTAESTGSLGW